MSTYRERREAKAERLREWAEKRETRAIAEHDRARELGSIIPFGQPILVGHHSEGRDRRYRDRIGRTYERAFENANKATAMNRRADGIERGLEQSIYSDDPDAVEALEARIAELEAERDAIKAENAAFRKAHRVELKALTAYGRDQAMPHRGYVLSNLTGNIKRNRDRLVVVRRQQTRAVEAETSGGIAVVEQSAGYVSVTFAVKPDRETIDGLKAAGFRWSQGSWWGSRDRLPEGVTS